MIKIATEEDFDLVLKHAKEFSSTLKQKEYVEDDKLELIIRNFLTAPKEEKIILLHGEEGMLAALVTSYVLGFAPVAQEFAWWVIPSARKKNVGKELIAAFEFWAKKLDCKQMVLSCYAENDLGKFYETMGYSLTEKAYYKEIK